MPVLVASELADNTVGFEYSALRMNLKDNLVEELSLVERTIELMDKSRMNKGILFIPEGLKASPDTLDDDSFEDELIEAMSQPVSEDFSETSFMGFIIRGPEALLDKVKHIDFTRDDEFRETLCARVDNLKTRIKHLEELESA